VPALILWGDRDTWVPLARGQSLAAALPGSRFVVIANAGHVLMEEQAGPFNTALLEFLGETVEPGAGLGR
jgi:pimeloyl-ACP methyl ester carboxylesterase